MPPSAPTTHERIQSLTTPKPSHLSGFRLLLSGQDAFTARAELICHAVRTLDLQYYITHDGISTRLLLGELLRAADRGVRIRLLLDDFASDARDHRILLSVAHPNIEMKVFNPPRRGRKRTATRMLGRLLGLSRQHRRMHNKLLLADGELAVMGGRNLGDEYFDVERSRNFIDIEVLSIGPVTEQLSACFEQYWQHPLSVPIEDCVRKPGRRQPRSMQQALDDAWARAPEHCASLTAYRQQPRLDAWLDDLIWAPGHALWDPPDKILSHGIPDKEQLLASPLLPVLLAVRQELVMVSAYFVPTQAGVTYFQECRQRGVSVRILTNALEATDVPLVHGGYQPYRPALLRSGVQLFEMRKHPSPSSRYNLADTDASLHSKAAVFDGSRVFIGPLNVDPRSVLWNTEVGVLIDSPALAETVRDLLTEGMSGKVSYEVQQAGTGNDQELVWLTDSRTGQPLQLAREPGGLWRRLNAWVARVMKLEPLL